MYYKHGIRLHGLSKRTALDIKQEQIIIIIIFNYTVTALVRVHAVGLYRYIYVYKRETVQLFSTG